jgi:hypothetical protein
VAKKPSKKTTQKGSPKSSSLNPNDAMTLRYQAMQKAVEAGKQVAPTISVPSGMTQAQAESIELGKALDAARYAAQVPGTTDKQIFGPTGIVSTYTGITSGAGGSPGVGLGGVKNTYTDEDFTDTGAFKDKGKQGASPEMQDAFAMLKDLFIQYNLEELLPAINELMISGVGPAAATLALKTDPKYNKDAVGNAIGYARRFAGNEMRRKQGLNVLSEAEYLALENSYSETLTSFGLLDYFGPKGAERTQKMAEVIGSNISAVEFSERVQTASNRVINTDKATRDSFKLIYGITDADLTRYFLDPKNNVNVLKEKVATAEIYGAAVAQGLAGSVEVSTELAKFGVDKQLARQGYSVIAEVLPDATKLSQIYEELPAYTQQTAEAEVFQGLASAQRTRQRLAQREIAEFSGSAGLSSNALTRQTGGQI